MEGIERETKVNQKEIALIVKKAEQGPMVRIDDGLVEMWGQLDVTSGCAFPEFPKKGITLKCAVTFLRYQAVNLFGGWNPEELAECCWLLQKKFFLVGDGADC